MPRDITQLARDILEVYGGKKSPYSYGCSGEAPSQDLRNKKTAQYPSFWATTSNRLYRDDNKSFMNADMWCDCIGFALRTLCLYDRNLRPIGCGGPGESPWTVGGKNLYNQYLGNSKSKFCMDISASGCNNLYGGKPISTLPEPTTTQAIWVFMKGSNGKVGHIGLYVGNGEVIEQTPKWLMKTSMKTRKWHYWGYVPTHLRDFVEIELGYGSKMDTSIPGATNTKKPVVSIEPKPVSTTEQPEAMIVAKASGKDYETIALQVYRGKNGWGNMPQRKPKIEAAGYNYQAIRAMVEALCQSNGRSFI